MIKRRELTDDEIDEGLKKVASKINGEHFENYGAFEDRVAALIESETPEIYAWTKTQKFSYLAGWTQIRNYIHRYATVTIEDR